MEQKSYHREIIVSASPLAAYHALTAEISKWWVAPEGNATAVGDTPIFRFPPTFWKMRVKNLVPEKQVIWECVDGNHIDKGLRSDAQGEWVGTTLKWEIDRKPLSIRLKTRIRFVHDGLNPTLKCYEICKTGWNYFFVGSLQKYLNSGKGTPFEY